MRTFERCLALGLMLVAGIAIHAASRLTLWQEYTVGPGAAPIAYGIAVLICGAFILARPSGTGVLDLGPLFPQAVMLAALMAGLTIVIGYVGFTLGLLAFTGIGLIVVSRLGLLYALPLTAIWVALLYGVFVHLLRIPFPRGSLF